jgi:hypothetical protein
MDFVHDLRSRVIGRRVIGQPEISTHGFHPYRVAIRDALRVQSRSGARLTIGRAGGIFCPRHGQASTAPEVGPAMPKVRRPNQAPDQFA